MESRIRHAARITIGTMLRLDPAFPPLWRSATTLQFGADAVAVLDDPEPWQQRLLRELERGIPDAALDPIAIALGAPEAAAGRFVRRIAPALIGPPAPRVRVILQVPEGFPRETTGQVAHSLRSAGLEVTEATWWDAPGEPVPDAAPVVILGHHLIAPRRAAALMGRDLAHLPLIFTGPGAEIGPFVVPGRTACLSCIAARRRDDDPAWPHVAAQLLGRTAPVLSDALTVEASLVAARLISEAVRSPRRLRSHSLSLREGSLHRSMRVHRPHAACRCRSLAGTWTADDPAVPATTTATVLARPA
ncbi:hypothetical protein SAMN04487846_2319 [Microbacterium sp. cf046]|nr:hypothetical protein SAMN04487846_2319 [Microbacterium sp. cf046]